MIVVVIIAIVLFCYYYIYKPHQHWKERNVPYKKPIPLLGNLMGIFSQRETFHEWSVKLYNSQATKVIGIFSFRTPVLVIRDLNLIKKIGIKEFDHFADHRQIVPGEVDPLFGRNLFTLKGDKWRKMRSTLSPAFTSSKMRSMYVLIAESAQQFTDYFSKIIQPGTPLEIELKDTFTRFANDVVATTAFGVQCDSFKDKNNEFYLMGKDATDFSGIKALKFFLYELSERLMHYLNVQIFSKKVSAFFRNLIKTTLEVREREGIVRMDMIHLLMEARKGKLKHEETDEDAGFATVTESDVGKGRIGEIELTDDLITAQALLFFVAGFDTISTAMCFMAYELAQHPEMQIRLQREIDDTLEAGKGKISYEALVKMKYLDMVLTETLRKWPPSPALDRICTKPIKLSAEDTGGTDITLKVNDLVWIPLYAIHMDPQYYPDPEKFDPERFSDENKHNINPMAFFPFGVGPRNCVGSRFALLEAKTIFVHILSKFSFVVSKKTQIPLQFKKGTFNLIGKDGMWVGLQKRNQQ